jgi:YbbR domain-containing protein
MPLRDAITKDMGWKIFSLGLAVAIWFTVHSISSESTSRTNPLAGTVTRSFEKLPVLVVSSAADVREFKVHPDTVDVVVSGRPDVVAALEQKDIHVIVDLTGIEVALELKKRVDISTPPGVTFVRVLPEQVDVVVPPKPRK